MPEAYPHGHESIGTAREIWDGALSPQRAVSTFRNAHRLFATRAVAPAPAPRPLPVAAEPLGAVVVEHDGRTHTLDDVLELNRVAGLLVLRDGEIVAERHRLGNDERTRWMSMSVAKSVLASLVGVALAEGRMHLDDTVGRYVPRLVGTAWDEVTVLQLLRMRSGVRYSEVYGDPTSDRRRMLDAQIAQEPGGVLAFLATLPRDVPAGTRTHYDTGQPQVLAEVVRGAVGMPVSSYLEQRIWRPAGMEAEARWWLDAPGGTEIGGSGLNATLRDYGRWGQFVLDDGVLDGRPLWPPGWRDEMGRTHSQLDGTTVPYGLLWWPGTTPLARRHGAFTAEGIHGQFVHIDPAARVVIVQWGARSEPLGGEVVPDALVFDALVEAAVRGR